MRKPIHLVLSVIFAALAGSCVSPARREPAAFKFNVDLKPEPMSIRDVAPVTNPKPAPKVAGYLDQLRSRFPTYFNAYALVYESFSLQAASIQYPRAIVFGREARVMISFNGHPKMLGGNAIETAEYVPSEGIYFREIGFPRDGYAVDPGEAEIDPTLSTRDVVVTKPNQARCTRCHSTDLPRYIMDNYFTWAGFYGSDDDNVYRESLRSSQFRAGIMIGVDFERDGWRQFIDQGSRSPRYRTLGKIWSTPTDVSGAAILDEELRPNFALTRRMQAQTFAVAAREIVDHPRFTEWQRYLGASEECAGRYLDTTPLIPRKYRAQFATLYQTNEREVRRDIATYRAGVRGRQHALMPGLKFADDDVDEKEVKSVARMMTALALMGLDLRRYLINPNRLATYADGTQSLRALGQEILQRTLVVHPERTWARPFVQPDVFQYSSGANELKCAEAARGIDL